MNNDLHQVDGKFYKECSIVMLPTDKATVNGIGKIHNKLVVLKREIHGNRVFDVGVDESSYNGILFPQHLYFLSNEEIKEGDYCYLHLGENSRIVKIKSLQSDHPIFNIYIGDGYAKLTSLSKIIATTDDLYFGSYNEQLKRATYSILRPSKEFIKKYAELGGINKCLVEYFDVGEEDWMGDDYTGEPFWNSHYKLKVNPDNTIVIKPISVDIEKQALDIIQEELKAAGIWQYVNMNQSGYSQVERNIATRILALKDEENKAFHAKFQAIADKYIRTLLERYTKKEVGSLLYAFYNEFGDATEEQFSNRIKQNLK